jgi:hypothetical protein
MSPQEGQVEGTRQPLGELFRSPIFPFRGEGIRVFNTYPLHRGCHAMTPKNIAFTFPSLPQIAITPVLSRKRSKQHTYMCGGE